MSGLCYITASAATGCHTQLSAVLLTMALLSSASGRFALGMQFCGFVVDGFLNIFATKKSSDNTVAHRIRCLCQVVLRICSKDG
jgi:hypothetical protein